MSIEQIDKLLALIANPKIRREDIRDALLDLRNELTKTK